MHPPNKQTNKQTKRKKVANKLVVRIRNSGADITLVDATLAVGATEGKTYVFYQLYHARKSFWQT
jgi:hypothetical protein